MSACFLVLSFLDSIFFDLNFHAHFLLFFCLTDLILMFEILIKSTITKNYSVLCHAFLEKFSVCSVSHHILSSCLRFQSSLFLQAVIQFYAAFSKKSFVCTHEYLISCSILEKDFLFALSNFQFRSTNFSSICIQCVRVNLTNLINKDLISSANQIQSEVSNQL